MAQRSAQTSSRSRSSKAAVPTNPYFVLRPSPIQGMGAFAIREIPAGTRIIEYAGERISQEEANERYDDTAMSRHHTFLFSVDDDTCIDASREYNEARYINHSCEPNTEAVDEKGRIYIYSLRDIMPGEELVYDYAFERDEHTTEEDEQRYACHCGAPTCRGTILAPPRKPERPARAKRAGSKRTPSKPSGPKRTTRGGGKRASKRSTR
jgi:SET domain-containing protein